MIFYVKVLKRKSKASLNMSLSVTFKGHSFYFPFEYLSTSQIHAKFKCFLLSLVLLNLAFLYHEKN